MRKKRLNEIFRWGSFIGKCFIACMLIPLTVSNAWAQAEQKISISVKDALIRTVLEELQKKANVNFVYEEAIVSSTRKVSLELKDASLTQILDELCKKISLRYEMEKGLVLLLPLKKDDALKQREYFTLRGLVSDESKVPIAGATIIVKGTTVGCATGMDGRYSIYLPKSQSITLIFSFVGMKTKEVKYAGRDTINVVLEEDVAQVDEVVVTGYQVIREKSMAGAVSKVKAEDLLLNGTQTLEQALQGKIPGMMVMSTSGLTGTRQRVRVRGTSTLLGNAEPVWVVDGVIQEDPLPFKSNDFNNLNQDNMDMIRDFVGGAIAWLNPNDIETVTVLKDAASTAIYGVKAANGVIVITTRKGKVGRMSVSYRGNFSLSPRMTYDKLELMNSKQRVDVSREAYETGIPLAGNQDIGYTALAKAFRNREISLQEFSEQVKQLEKNNTDWFKILFRNAFSHNHNISISGGSDKAMYHASFGVSSKYNTARGNDQTQYTANVSVSSNLWERITLSTSLAGSVSDTRAFAGTDPYTYARTTNRAIAYKELGGDLYYYKNAENGFLYNIENELANSGNENTLSSVNASMSLRWRISDDLSFSTSLSYSHSESNGQSWYTEESNYIANIRRYNFGEYEVEDDKYKQSKLPHGGELNQSQNSGSNWGWRNQFDYVKVFNGVHAVSVALGHEMRSSHTTGSSLRSYGYMPDRGKIFVNLPPNPDGGSTINELLRSVPTLLDSKSNNLSYYLALSYMFDDRYAVNMSVRGDASNRFGQDKSNRFQPVWAVGLRWNVGQEHWLQGQDILSDMNLRFSYGYQGNVVESVSPELIAIIGTEEKNYDYTLKIKDLPAPELKWEKVRNVNYGVNFSLFKNKISFGFDGYYKKTTDMVINLEVPYENGVAFRPINGGNMTNKGWDASVSFIPVRARNFVVSMGVSTGKVYNKIESALEPTGDWQEATGGNLNKKGYAVSSFWAFRFAGLNPENGGPMFDLSGSELDEAKADATLYMNYAGKLEPDFNCGLSFSIRYKTLSLSSGLYLSVGNQQFLSPMDNNKSFDNVSIPSEYKNMSKEWLKRWRKPGDEKYTNVPSLPNYVSSAKKVNVLGVSENPYKLYAYSDVRVVDAWYLRCSSISLSYTLPERLLPNSLKNLGFSFSLSNPFQIRSKDFKGRDPEVALGNQPLSRSVSFGLNMSF